MSAHLPDQAEARREYVLAEFRCALIRTKLAQLDIEAVACALQHRIITADQALAFFLDTDAVRSLGLNFGGREQ